MRHSILLATLLALVAGAGCTNKKDEPKRQGPGT